MPELLWPSLGRKMCVIFCPLDMKGLIGAATAMGSMYGAGHCWNGMINMHLRHSSLDAVRVMINFFFSLITWMFRLALWGVTPCGLD